MQVIDEMIQNLGVLVTDPDVVQIEMTIIGLIAMLAVIGKLIIGMIDSNSSGNEYNATTVEYDENEEDIK